MGADEEWHYIQVPKLGRAWVGWGKAKNRECMRKHGVSFEAVLVGLMECGVSALYQHPNATRYPSQHILEVEVCGYMHCSPCIVSRSSHDEPSFFLKTVYPSRKANGTLRG